MIDDGCDVGSCGESPYIPPSYCETHPGACGGGNPEDKLKKDKKGDASNATIRIGFGTFDENGNPLGFEGRGAGLGTVIHNGDGYSSIITAWHVYAPGSYFFYRTGEDAELHYLSMYDVRTFPLGRDNDLLIINLPIELPNEYVPAQIGHTTLTGGEPVTVAYQDENRGLHVLETEVRTHNLFQPGTYGGSGISVVNPNGILNHGDSGGGVFYNGYLIGVSSYISNDSWGPFDVFEIP